MHRRGLASLATALSLVGCGEARPPTAERASCLTWKTDLAPVFAQHCASCHSGDTPAGSYDLTHYSGILGNGTDGTANAIAGDPTSLLLSRIDSPDGDAAHAMPADVVAEVQRWVVECRLAYEHSDVHGGGLLNPADPQFHGRVLHDIGWSFSRCAQCHGSDFEGGASGRSCYACHDQGPQSCTTCHGSPPATGAHQVHVGGTLAGALDCSNCHPKPQSWSDPGHILNADGTRNDAPPTVQFGMLASTVTPDRQGPPTWDRASGSCTNVYCHGAAFKDQSATSTTPKWSSNAPCGSCHGLPPSSHASDQCVNCHGLVVDGSRNIINTALHVDGKVSLGNDSGTCTACHGSGDNPAPPRDLSGNTSPSAIGVGAHEAHLGAKHRLRGPVQCGDCHAVPASVTSPGHIDSASPAKVFPDSISSTSLAFGDSAQPAWDHDSATCSNVYCHGGGKGEQDDAAMTLARKPVWTGTSGSECGTCHGIPPKNSVHYGTMTLGQCAQCHPQTMDPSGSIIVTNGQSTHINGVIDVR